MVVCLVVGWGLLCWLVVVSCPVVMPSKSFSRIQSFQTESKMLKQTVTHSRVTHSCYSLDIMIKQVLSLKRCCDQNTTLQISWSTGKWTEQLVFHLWCFRLGFITPTKAGILYNSPPSLPTDKKEWKHIYIFDIIISTQSLKLWYLQREGNKKPSNILLCCPNLIYEMFIASNICVYSCNDTYDSQWALHFVCLIV